MISSRLLCQVRGKLVLQRQPVQTSLTIAFNILCSWRASAQWWVAIFANGVKGPVPGVLGPRWWWPSFNFTVSILIGSTQKKKPASATLDPLGQNKCKLQHLVLTPKRGKGDDAWREKDMPSLINTCQVCPIWRQQIKKKIHSWLTITLWAENKQVDTVSSTAQRDKCRDISSSKSL